jgi:phosphatidylglycerophosphatase A
MKQTLEKRDPNGVVDQVSLAMTTFGVGYIPGAPGTYGSMVAVAIYLVVAGLQIACGAKLVNSGYGPEHVNAGIWALNAVLLTGFCIVGIIASERAIPMLGNSDPSEAVVDELMGQFIAFAFIPVGLGWPFILAGFLLFRLFDIWKPYPIDDLQNLPGGLGVCADDIVAGVYAGVCLAVGYAVYLYV